MSQFLDSSPSANSVKREYDLVCFPDMCFQSQDIKSCLGSKQQVVDKYQCTLADLAADWKCWNVAPTEEGDAGNDDSRLLPGFLICFPVSWQLDLTVQALAMYSLALLQMSELSDQMWMGFFPTDGMK